MNTDTHIQSPSVQSFEAGSRRTVLWICILLAASTALVYWPVAGHPFVHYDDHNYVSDNPYLRSGLTPANVRWAFTVFYQCNWHPLTWLSHMADVQLFGLKAGWHHLTNLVLHIVNTLLLFLVFRGMTGAIWRSAFVAALFGLHPVHVESVAWVAERKDVLSAFFFMLTLWAYGRYAEVRSAKCEVRSRVVAGDTKSEIRNPKSEARDPECATRSREQGTDDWRPEPPAEDHPLAEPKPDAAGSRSTLHAPRFFLLALVLFALGLMSKPMVVTLPFVLLLLDYWPLRRIERRSPACAAKAMLRLVFEKMPFFALAAISCVITFQAQRSGGAVLGLNTLPLSDRAANAAISYVRYVGKLFWPSDLAVFYPRSEAWPPGQLAGAGLVLVLVTALAVLTLRRLPFLGVGWFWFVGMLVPVIGIVQVGGQGMADRYTYLPAIGLAVMVVWGVAEVLARIFHTPHEVATPPSAGPRPGVRVLSYRAGSETGAPTGGCEISGLAGKARERLLAIGAGLLALVPLAMVAHKQVGYWKDWPTLIAHAQAVTPENYTTEFLLGNALVDAGQVEAGIGHLRRAVELNSLFAELRTSLAYALNGQGKFDEAAAQYREALKLQPDFPTALNNLAWLLATCADSQVRDGNEAVQAAERACKLTGFREAQFVGTLAAAYAEAGRFEEALRSGEQARELALAGGLKDLARRNGELIEEYRLHRPHREPAPVKP